MAKKHFQRDTAEKFFRDTVEPVWLELQEDQAMMRFEKRTQREEETADNIENLRRGPHLDESNSRLNWAVVSIFNYSVKRASLNQSTNAGRNATAV